MNRLGVVVKIASNSNSQGETSQPQRLEQILDILQSNPAAKEVSLQ